VILREFEDVELILGTGVAHDFRIFFFMKYERICFSFFTLFFLCFVLEKRREFYENAKYVSKFKKKLKQQNQPNELSSAVRSSGV